MRDNLLPQRGSQFLGPETCVHYLPADWHCASSIPLQGTTDDRMPDSELCTCSGTVEHGDIVLVSIP